VAASTTSEQTGEPLLRCEQLVVGWNGRAILPPIDLAIHRGKVLIVVGRNGSGKTTWFKTMLGLLAPVGGRVVRAMPEVRLTYVPQVFAIDPILPVRGEDVVAWGRLRGWSFLRPSASVADREACASASSEAGIADLAHVSYSALSEGQKQRVLFARLLAAETDVAFLDEPTASMDPVAEHQAFEQLMAVVRARDLAIVMVSHHLGHALHHADEVLFLDREDGAVVIGTPSAVINDPAFRRCYGEVTLGERG
jgi:zinc transport system ATP-binding protein